MAPMKRKQPSAKGVAKGASTPRGPKRPRDAQRTPEGYVLDTKGQRTSPKDVRKSSKDVRTSLKDVLGFDTLLQKERQLAEDLFGDDADVQFGAEEAEDARREPDEAEGKAEDDPEDEAEDAKPQRKPVWVDEDDDDIKVKDVVSTLTKGRGKRGVREASERSYESALQQTFRQVVSDTPEWAQLGRKDDEIRTTSDFLSREASTRLPKTRLDHKRLSDLNRATRAEGGGAPALVVKAVHFNPKFRVALAAGFSGKGMGVATLFQVDGRHNPKIQSVTFPSFPVRWAAFLGDGRRFAAASGAAGHFYVYDMEAGRETRVPALKTSQGQGVKGLAVSPDGDTLVLVGRGGRLHLYDATALSLVQTLTAPEEVAAVAFNDDGSRMYTHGAGGDVLVWDAWTRSCVHRFWDEGCLEGTGLAASPDGRYLACGAASGVVNVYDAHGLSSAPRPLKTLDRLATPVSALAFNPSSEILAVASDHVDDAIKMVHLPSMTSFANFPGGRRDARRVQTFDFSPRSGFFALGNNAGRASLYRLNHFSDY